MKLHRIIISPMSQKSWKIFSRCSYESFSEQFLHLHGLPITFAFTLITLPLFIVCWKLSPLFTSPSSDFGTMFQVYIFANFLSALGAVLLFLILPLLKFFISFLHLSWTTILQYLHLPTQWASISNPSHSIAFCITFVMKHLISFSLIFLPCTVDSACGVASNFALNIFLY